MNHIARSTQNIAHLWYQNKRILFKICATLPKKFTRKEFNLTIRDHFYSTHPDHYLQRLVEKGFLKYKGKGIYELA